MASAQSSHDMWRSRGRQPQTLGNAQPRHRSESRRLSERRRPVKTVARERDHRPGVLHEGDPVRVFSRSGDKWVDGEVVKFVEDDFVRVEYEIGTDWCGKFLHVHSDHLVIPSTTSIMSEEDEEQYAKTSSSDFLSAQSPLVEAAQDSRWLLSCKFDVNRGAPMMKAASLIEQILGSENVNNPNRFSKTCCTIAGEEWDDNYNKGDNREKYLRCWEPNAPAELKCTKGESTFVDGQPSLRTCWKFSYFWRLSKCRKMLRVIEGGKFGEGQELEKAMAEFLESEAGGCKVRVVKVPQLWHSEHLDFRQFGFAAYSFSETSFTKCIAMIHAQILAAAGFDSPRILEMKVLKDYGKSVCPIIAAGFEKPNLEVVRFWQATKAQGQSQETLEGRALIYLKLRRELEEIQALRPSRGPSGVPALGSVSKSKELHRIIKVFDKSSLIGLANLLVTTGPTGHDKFSMLIEDLPPEEIHKMIKDFDKFSLPCLARLASQAQFVDIEYKPQALELLGELQFIQALHPGEFHKKWKDFEECSFPGLAEFMKSTHFDDFTEDNVMKNVGFLLGARYYPTRSECPSECPSDCPPVVWRSILDDCCGLEDCG